MRLHSTHAHMCTRTRARALTQTHTFLCHPILIYQPNIVKSISRWPFLWADLPPPSLPGCLEYWEEKMEYLEQASVPSPKEPVGTSSMKRCPFPLVPTPLLNKTCIFQTRSWKT